MMVKQSEYSDPKSISKHIDSVPQRENLLHILQVPSQVTFPPWKEQSLLAFFYSSQHPA